MFKLYEQLTNQVTTLTQAEPIRELPDARIWRQRQGTWKKWEIKYLGPETMDGVKTEKLELVAKDPNVRKNIAQGDDLDGYRPRREPEAGI